VNLPLGFLRRLFWVRAASNLKDMGSTFKVVHSSVVDLELLRGNSRGWQSRGKYDRHWAMRNQLHFPLLGIIQASGRRHVRRDQGCSLKQQNELEGAAARQYKLDQAEKAVIEACE
jgi:hypothetical protein